MKEIVIGKHQASIAELIGKGGEGRVYTIKGHPGLVVKIYNPDKRSEREDKVRAMVGERLSEKTDLIAYPGNVVTDQNGNFLGFVMRLVPSCEPLHELYTPKSRQRLFPNADYRFLVRTALNVARAVGKVHQTGCIIGDLNHSGVLVAQDSTVALIDADSFQLNLNDKTYPCVVGVPEFTPPELHGKNFTAYQRTLEHDYFGLAVAIFHLLFMGRHPYAGCYVGPDISLGESIAQNRFAFSRARQATTQTSPPPGSLTLDMFPDVISLAFETGFGISPDARPTAKDWIHALSSLENSLNRCSKVSTHYYPNSAGGCIWCRLASNSGFDMFPDLTPFATTIQTDSYSTEEAIQEIQAFRFPSVADLVTSSGQQSVSKTLRKSKNGKHELSIFGLLLIGGAVASYFYSAQTWFIWLGLAIWVLSIFSRHKAKASLYQKAFKLADERVQRELNNLIHRSGMYEIVKTRNDLNITISSYRNLKNSLVKELVMLKSSRETRQRQNYLDSFPIRHARISGIGPAKTATLISFGIETAADVNSRAILSIPGFGEVMAGKLMAWRRSHESQFKFNPMSTTQDTADERALQAQLSGEKAKLESTIRNGMYTLRHSKSLLDALPNKAKNDKRLTEATAARAQAAQDLRELGISIPASKVSLKWLYESPQVS